MKLDVAETMHAAQGHGHAHFWERALITRRHFLQTAAATSAVAFGSGLGLPMVAHAAGPEPKPIPGTTTIPFGTFHFNFPTGGPPDAITIESGKGEVSLITDFNGVVGVGDFANGKG